MIHQLHQGVQQKELEYNHVQSIFIPGVSGQSAAMWPFFTQIKARQGIMTPKGYQGEARQGNIMD